MAQAPVVVNTSVRKQQRQFGLATVILILGGGAAAARTRSGRRSGPQ